jgi:hypothetical protein
VAGPLQIIKDVPRTVTFIDDDHRMHWSDVVLPAEMRQRDSLIAQSPLDKSR